MHRYYVSFSFQASTGLGIGALDVTTGNRITKVDDLADVIPQITSQGYRNVTILAFSLYAQEKPVPGPRPRSGGHRR